VKRLFNNVESCLFAEKNAAQPSSAMDRTFRRSCSKSIQSICGGPLVHVVLKFVVDLMYNSGLFSLYFMTYFLSSMSTIVPRVL